MSSPEILAAVMAVLTAVASVSHIPVVDAWVSAKSWGPWVLQVLRQLAVNPIGALKK